MFKKIISFFFLIIFSFININFSFSAPSFSDDFSKSIDTNDKSSGTDEEQSAYSPKKMGIDSDRSLKENIINMFSPTRGGDLWDVIRTVGVGAIIAFIVWNSILLLLYSENEEEIKKYKINYLYIVYGGFLFFGVTWILGTALNIGGLQGTEGAVSNIKENLLFQVLGFLKAAAFFIAIIMITYYGFKIISAYENEDKISEAKKGVLNVILALIFIKIIDYVFFIAQKDNFTSQATEFIVELSKILGYVLGGVLLLALFYAGVMMITSRGDTEYYKKAKYVVVAVFLVATIVMLFLLIFYQVINELV